MVGMSHGVDQQLHARRDEIKELLLRTRSKSDYRRVLCVWLRLALSLSSRQIAVALGLSPSTVRRVQSDFTSYGPRSFSRKGRGGPHRRYLTEEEERNLVSKYRRRTRYGAAFNVTAFRAEFESKAGKSVALSTIYRLLMRHGCRQLLPRARPRTG
jgi:transposase